MVNGMLNDVIVRDEINTEISIEAPTVTGILGLEKNITGLKHHQSIGHYEVDLDEYDDVYNSSTILQEKVTEGSKSLGVYDKLNKDMFLSLYKYKPEIVKESSMHSSTVVNNRLMKELVKAPEFRNLRNNCAMDPFASMLGTQIVGEKAIPIVEKWKNELTEKLSAQGKSNPFDNLDDLVRLEEQLDDLLKTNDTAQELLDDLASKGINNGDAYDNLKNLTSSLGNEISQLQQSVGQQSNQLDDLLQQDDCLVDLARQMSSALSFADDVISHVVPQLNAWGFERGSGTLIPYADKKIALERIRDNKKFKEIVKLLGKLKCTAISEQKKKDKDGNTSINSIGIGNKLENVLPSEMMKLCNQTTKRDFMRRFSQKQLMIYTKNGVTKKNKGPIVVCIDTSGSMSGSREKWSKAIALAMLEIASIQKRDYAAIMFSSRAEKPIVIERNEVSPKKVLDIAELFTSGGTDFEEPLDKAIELIKTSQFNKADIVFITDGECDVSSSFLNNFNKVKEDKKFKVKSILINTDGSVSDTALQKFSDDIITLDKISDLSNSNSDVARALFSGV